MLEDQGLTYLSAMDKDEMACHPLFQEFVPEPASKEDYEQILALHEFQPTDENQLFYTYEKGKLVNADLYFLLMFHVFTWILLHEKQESLKFSLDSRTKLRLEIQKDRVVWKQLSGMYKK